MTYPPAGTQRDVIRLRELLGAQLVAYIACKSDTTVVHEWAEGNGKPFSSVQRKLEIALRLAEMLSEVERQSVVQAWFMGLAHTIWCSPARCLRESDPSPQEEEDLWAEARAFIAY